MPLGSSGQQTDGRQLAANARHPARSVRGGQGSGGSQTRLTALCAAPQGRVIGGGPHCPLALPPLAPVLSARAAGTRLVSVGRELSRAMSPRGAGVGTRFSRGEGGCSHLRGASSGLRRVWGPLLWSLREACRDMPPLVLALVLEPSPPRAPSSCTPTLSPFSESFSEHPTRCVRGRAWGCRGSLPVLGRRPVARPASRAACGTWALGATPSFISSPTAAPRVAAPGGWPLRPCIFV